MVGATATATEMQNNFGRYLSIMIGGAEVIVTKKRKRGRALCPQGYRHLLSDGFSDRNSDAGDRFVKEKYIP